MITCFSPVDEYYRSNPEDLIDLQERVIRLFSGGYIPVSDRAIKVKSSPGGMDTDRVYVDLQLEYFDDRITKKDEIMKMKDINITIKEE